MKSLKAGKRRPAAKGKGAAKTVEDYLARVPEPARGTLMKIRAAIRSAAPAGSIEIISYGIPAFRHKKVLVWYAAFTKHCSFFPTGAVIEEFKDELKGFATSKGTIQFPTDKALSADLVRRMVKARVALIESKKAH